MGSKLFAYGAVAFLCGVAVASVVPLGWSVAFLLIVIACAVLSYGMMNGEMARAAYIAVVCIACAGGIARVSMSAVSLDPSVTRLLGTHARISGIVIDAPDERETSTMLTIAIASSSQRLIATLPAHADVAYGDFVTLEGDVALPRVFESDTGIAFDYPGYLASRGICCTMQRARVVSAVHDAGGDVLHAYAFAMKQWFVRGVRAALPEPEAGLAAGITVGDKHSVGAQLSQDFARDSLSHVVVLSGYNITFIANAASAALPFLSPLARTSAGVLAALFLVIASGSGASAVRAGIMAAIAAIARTTGREYSGARALLIAACAMALWDPLVVMFDPGFQLSALASLGLVLFGPVFSEWFARVPTRFGLREILATTCATQLAVLPLLLHQNGTLSLVALPANLVVLAPVPLATVCSFAAGIAGALSGTIGMLVATPAYVLLAMIIAAAHLFASLPFAAVQMPPPSTFVVLVMYTFLFGGYLFLKKKQKQQAE